MNKDQIDEFLAKLPQRCLELLIEDWYSDEGQEMARYIREENAIHLSAVLIIEEILPADWSPPPPGYVVARPGDPLLWQRVRDSTYELIHFLRRSGEWRPLRPRAAEGASWRSSRKSTLLDSRSNRRMDDPP